MIFSQEPRPTSSALINLINSFDELPGLSSYFLYKKKWTFGEKGCWESCRQLGVTRIT